MSDVHECDKPNASSVSINPENFLSFPKIQMKTGTRERIGGKAKVLLCLYTQLREARGIDL